jgi:hypothetical protein
MNNEKTCQLAETYSLRRSATVKPHDEMRNLSGLRLR